MAEYFNNEYSLDQFEAAEWQRYLQGNIMYNFFNTNIDIFKKHFH